MLLRSVCLAALPATALSLAGACGGTGAEPSASGEAVERVSEALSDAGTCKGVAFTASPASPQALGALPILTAKARCDGASAEYEFLLTRPGGLQSVVQASSKVNTWPWDTSGEVGGDYVVEVTVHAKGASGVQAHATLPFTLSGEATVASGQVYPYEMTADATQVYWADFSNSGSIVAASIGGGTPSTLASGRDYPFSVVLSGGDVFWTETNGGNVMKVKATGGTPVTLASGQDYPYALAVYGKTVFWTNYESGTIAKVQTSGGATTTLASAQSSPSQITSDAKHIYWTVGSDAIVKLPHDGGTPSTIVSGPAVEDLVVSGSDLYFASGNAILSVPVTGGTPSTFASATSGTGALFIGGSQVYFTNGYSIESKSLSGGSPTVIVTASSQPTSIASDGTSVYWTYYNAGGEILKATP